MSKVEQIMETVSSLASDEKSKEVKLELFIAAASQVENQIAVNFNMDAPELALLLYNLSRRSEELKVAIQAVNAQLEEDNARALSNIIKLPIPKNKITS